MAHDAIHQSVLAGLLSQIGLRDGSAGTTSAPEACGSRSTLARCCSASRRTGSWPPSWSRPRGCGRASARRSSRSGPRRWPSRCSTARTASRDWSAKRGSVVAQEKVHLYGVPLVASRTVAYGRIDPELSRELFIRHALVYGEWQTHHQFFHDNRALLEDVQELEHRARRRDIVVDDETLVAFYDQRIPADVVSGRHFDSWWKKARHETPDLLTFTRELRRRRRVVDQPRRLPGGLALGDLELPLTYQFEPGTDADGVTVHVPGHRARSGRRRAGSAGRCPGLRLEMVIALIRSLPKAIRKNFVPVPTSPARWSSTSTRPAPSRWSTSSPGSCIA